MIKLFGSACEKSLDLTQMYLDKSANKKIFKQSRFHKARWIDIFLYIKNCDCRESNNLEWTEYFATCSIVKA